MIRLKHVSHVKLLIPISMFFVILNKNAYCHTIIPIENFSNNIGI